MSRAAAVDLVQLRFHGLRAPVNAFFRHFHDLLCVSSSQLAAASAHSKKQWGHRLARPACKSCRFRRFRPFLSFSPRSAGYCVCRAVVQTVYRQTAKLRKLAAATLVFAEKLRQ